MSEPRRQRIPGHERRVLILAAALEEFARHGYDGASMRRIGGAAGVTRTVLYDHFPSKRALFAALLQETHRTLLSHLRETITAEAPMEERIGATFDAYLAFAENEPLAWSLLFPDRAPIDPDVAADHRRCRTESNRLLAEVLAPDAKRAGIEPTSNVGQAIFAIHQAALHGAVRWWRAHPTVTRQELVKASMDALWSGLGGLERGEALAAPPAVA
jgi:AcrR family transcriptional regulator